MPRHSFLLSFIIVISAIASPCFGQYGYTSSSTMVKGHKAHEKFLSAIERNDSKAIGRLLADSLAFEFVDYIDTREEYLVALEEGRLNCADLKYTIGEIAEYHPDFYAKGKVDLLFHYQHAEELCEEIELFLSYEAKYTRVDGNMMMVRWKSSRNQTGLGSCGIRPE